MSNLFICGQHGCDVIDIDEIALRRAGEQTRDWAYIEYKKNGKYPLEKRYSRRFAANYQRLTQIKISKP